MAVYTDVSDEDLAAFLADYAIGDMLSLRGVAEGVENSNFLLHTTTGYYFLTLYEKRVDERDLPFFLGLLEHLAARGLTLFDVPPGRVEKDLAQWEAICRWLDTA